MKSLSFLFSFSLFLSLLSSCAPNDSHSNSHSNSHSHSNSSSMLSALAEKQKGAHVFSLENEDEYSILEPYHLNWVTMVSWAFQDSIRSNRTWDNRGDTTAMREYDERWAKRIQRAKGQGYKVFFKPHLWIQHTENGEWRSDIDHDTEEDWLGWRETYRSFILRYAKVAEAGNADMYCIGMEFDQLSSKRPEFWIELISDVRAVYSGKVIYAANWYEEYEAITFWEHLDYIGIQGYFPLCSKNNQASKT